MLKLYYYIIFLLKFGVFGIEGNIVIIKFSVHFI